MMSPDEQTKLEIGTLRKIEEKAFGPRHGKTDFYNYLDAAWNPYSLWEQGNRIRKRTERVARLCKVKLRKNTHPIRVIIDASSNQKADVKSEWTQALRYALKNKSQIKTEGLKKFLESNGGVAGCASQVAKHRPRKKAKEPARPVIFSPRVGKR
jgi:hypothetical protein